MWYYIFSLTGLQEGGYDIVEVTLGQAAIQSTRAPIPDGAGSAQRKSAGNQSGNYIQVKMTIDYGPYAGL